VDLFAYPDAERKAPVGISVYRLSNALLIKPQERISLLDGGPSKIN